jgi:hypothetical protein
VICHRSARPFHIVGSIPSAAATLLWRCDRTGRPNSNNATESWDFSTSASTVCSGDDLGTLVRKQDALLDSFFNTDQIRLQEASRVTHEALSFEHADAACRFDVTISPHAIAAITLEF